MKKGKNISLDISIVMPALNEEQNIFSAIDETLNALDYYAINGEIIVVNDGSKDRTDELIEKLIEKDSRVKMIRHENPMGIGRSFWDGVDVSTGDAVVMLPGDNENDAREILRYCEFLNHVDIIVPFVFNKEMRSLFRNALSFIYRIIINATFLVNFNYTNGTILYRKSILDKLNFQSTGFFFQTDILVRTVKKGYLFAEVPYRLDVRNNGKSRAVSFPSLLEVMKGYIRLVRDIYYTSRKTREKFTKDSLTVERMNKSE